MKLYILILLLILLFIVAFSNWKPHVTNKNEKGKHILFSCFENIYMIIKMEGKMAVRESRVNGLGLFATTPIEAGTVVLHLPGEVISLHAYLSLFPNFEGEWNCRRAGDGRGGNQIVYRAKKSMFSYVNHSRTPNVRIGDEFGSQGREDRLYATRLICAGEEILLDYRDNVPDEYFIFASSWM